MLLLGSVLSRSIICLLVKAGVICYGFDYLVLFIKMWDLIMWFPANDNNFQDFVRAKKKQVCVSRINCVAVNITCTNSTVTIRKKPTQTSAGDGVIK